MRRIIHVDMDAFYAAIEQRDDPSLRGRPIAVGSGGSRGVVLTASYEARPFGVRSAMPNGRARRLCPELLFVRPRFDAYKQASQQIRAIFARHTDLIEPLSLDEAYLDVTETCVGDRTAVEIARSIKAAIRAELSLTASAGVSFNKFLAKTASDLEKPDGLTVIRPAQALAFLAALPIERFHGVGPATARRMRARGITTGADLQARSEHDLTQAFGRIGRHYWEIAQARDEREVQMDRARRSLSVETTFQRDLRGREALEAALAPLAEELAARLARSSFVGRTLTLKLRYGDFQLASRRFTQATSLHDVHQILRTANELLDQRPRPDEPIRLLGLGVSNATGDEDARQFSLPLTATGSAGR